MRLFSNLLCLNTRFDFGREEALVPVELREGLEKSAREHVFSFVGRYAFESEDKVFEKVINPYLTEVLKQPQSIKMSKGMLHIRDVEGPKKAGSVETRLEAMEQQVFKCQGMVERGRNANHMMITEFTSNHKMDGIDIGKHLSRLYGRVYQLHG
ncbi:40S ribosomal protein S5-1 [Hordeum vulgare]|nr:40S ribosomal protein S5-1 [Hordeum vulgare]